MNVSSDVSSFKDIPLPLPIYSTVKINTIKSKHGINFELFVGASEQHVAQLKTYSLDENDSAIQDGTSDKKRFGEGSYKAWYAKGRVPFSLIEEETQKLAAFAWFGEEPLDEAQGSWHTIAYRAYVPFRGIGITKPFVQYAFAMYEHHYPKAFFWAAINEDDKASENLITSLGFSHSTYPTREGGKIVMIKQKF